MTFPIVANKSQLEAVHTPHQFVEALRKAGWEPGQVPESVIFTYARFELYLATASDLYTPNHMIGTRPGRFFAVNSSDARVGINCLRSGRGCHPPCAATGRRPHRPPVLVGRDGRAVVNAPDRHSIRSRRHRLEKLLG